MAMVNHLYILVTTMRILTMINPSGTNLFDWIAVLSGTLQTLVMLASFQDICCDSNGSVDHSRGK